MYYGLASPKNLSSFIYGSKSEIVRAFGSNKKFIYILYLVRYDKLTLSYQKSDLIVFYSWLPNSEAKEDMDDARKKN